jgi:hypothetical protein
VSYAKYAQGLQCGGHFGAKGIGSHYARQFVTASDEQQRPKPRKGKLSDDNEIYQLIVPLRFADINSFPESPAGFETQAETVLIGAG